MPFSPFPSIFISIEIIIESISPARSICMIVLAESIVTVLYNRATIIIRCTHVKVALHTKPPIQKRQRSVTIRSYLANRRSSRVLIPSPYHTHLHLSCIVKVGFIRCVGSSQISREYIAPA